MKKTIAWIIIILILGVIVWFVNLMSLTEVNDIGQSVYDGEAITYAENGNEFTVRFNENGDKVQLDFEGERYDLGIAISASGARYTNADESVVFWEHQGKGMIQMSGETLVSEAVPVNNGEVEGETNSTETESNKHNNIIGMTTTEAQVYAAEKDIDFRVTFLDGEALPATLDYRPGRISAEVVNDIVVGYTVE